MQKAFESNTELRCAIVCYFNSINYDCNYPLESEFDHYTKEDIINIYGDISNWDTSNIRLMQELFYKMPKISDEPIVLNWDTSRVFNMNMMFACCKQSFILNFDTSNLKFIYHMFIKAQNYNYPIYLKDTFKINNKLINNKVFLNTPLEHKEKDYVLPELDYNKLILIYALHQKTLLNVVCEIDWDLYNECF